MNKLINLIDVFTDFYAFTKNIENVFHMCSITEILFFFFFLFNHNHNQKSSLTQTDLCIFRDLEEMYIWHEPQVKLSVFKVSDICLNRYDTLMFILYVIQNDHHSTLCAHK